MRLKAMMNKYLLAFLILLSSFSSGQSPQGALLGTVVDPSGARVRGASVTASARTFKLSRTVQTNAVGEFRIEQLPPGTYDVTVTARGFATQSGSVEVAVAATPTMNIEMHAAPVQQTVTVQGETGSITAQPIETTNTVVKSTVGINDIAEVPLAHRSFANISYLAPMTEPVEPSDPTKARITAVSFGGSSGLNVDLSVDGGDNSDDYIGGFLQNFSPDGIQEFAVRTSQEDADTGRTVGGSVIITTKHGTNSWHGSGAFYDRTAGMSARFPIDNPAPEPKQPFSRQNWVATLGGPLKRDKLWFFASFEAVDEDASISYSPASLGQFNALAGLAAQGLIQGVNNEGQPVGVSSIGV